MKKMIITIAMSVLCLCATSCSSKIEDAYIAEMNYRSVKDVMSGSAAEHQYKEEFIKLWASMTKDERIEYRNYRSYMENEVEQAKAIEAEAMAVINE